MAKAKGNAHGSGNVGFAQAEQTALEAYTGFLNANRNALNRAVAFGEALLALEPLLVKPTTLGLWCQAHDIPRSSVGRAKKMARSWKRAEKTGNPSDHYTSEHGLNTDNPDKKKEDDDKKKVKGPKRLTLPDINGIDPGRVQRFNAAVRPMAKDDQCELLELCRGDRIRINDGREIVLDKPLVVWLVPGRAKPKGEPVKVKPVKRGADEGRKAA